jgi:hypothetical protein
LTAAYLVIFGVVLAVWTLVPSIRETAGRMPLLFCCGVLLGLCCLWATLLVR